MTETASDCLKKALNFIKGVQKTTVFDSFQQGECSPYFLVIRRSFELRSQRNRNNVC